MIARIVDKLTGIYAVIFSKGVLSKVNNVLLKAALRARGYNNFRNYGESGESFFIEKVLAPTNPKLCIDIGANVGDFSKEILEKTTASVISFEPLPPAFEILKKSVSVYGDRVAIENRGVGEKAETLEIHYDLDALSRASFSEDVKKVSYVSNELKVEVPVITLDEYCAENSITEVDFVKIDTEGFEAEIFKGAARVFGEIKPRFIQIEFNWHQLFRNTTLNYFAERLPDYEVYQLLPNGWVKRDPKHPLANIFEFSNFIFVLK